MGLDLALKLQRIGRPRVLCIGDYIHDQTIQCEGGFRFSQEASHCPVWKFQHSHTSPGGAGAVAAMAESLGADVTSIVSPASHSATKTRYFVGDTQMLRVDDGPKPFTPHELGRLTQQIYDEVERSSCVLVADYAKGFCTKETLQAAIDSAHACKIPCIVDPAHGKPWDSYKGATCIKCNEHEWKSSVKSWRHEFGACPNVLEINNLHFEAAVCTHGANGIVGLVRKEMGTISCKSRPRHTIDPTGCGDMVLATLGVCIAGGMTWQEACQVANSCAGIKVERRGAVPVPKAEVVLDLCDTKIIPAELLQSVRAAHKRIAFTNGVFDLLGPHHLYLLQEAKKHGDVLVVGLNDDLSVSRLKGPKRPIMRQEQRAAMLAGLACVDYVVLFSEDAPISLLTELRPDVLVKADDPERNTAGDDLAKEVVLIPMIAGASTTRTLDAIRG